MSKLLERIGKTWGDAARDIVLIVASILIAFALDAWWDGLKEQRAQSEQIATLLSEFEVARDTLASLADYVDSVADTTTELLTLMGPEAVGPESGELFTLLERSLNFGGSAPNHTALQLVLAAGNPRIEESELLAGLLGNWPSLMEDLKGDFAHLERNRDIELQGALIAIGVAGIASTPSTQRLGLPPSSFPVDTTRFAQSVEVYAVLSYRALRLKVLLLNVGAAIERADLIIGELASGSEQDAG